ARAEAANALVEKNEKIADFNRLFIEKVLEADREVDFDTRLQLENAVRGLNDQEIFDSWQEFVASKDSAAAQKNVLILLELLAGKL
ncbi:MAG: hypothetical protein PHQ42_05135, partial [Patescibacteria group bacterium]|nr:hypothetical protein [Patescibacteria group bacterium]